MNRAAQWSAFSACVAVSAVAWAPAVIAASDAERWMTLRIAGYGVEREDLSKDEAHKRVMPVFDQANTDGDDAISAADYELARRIKLSQQRSSEIAKLLRDDLNGDGRVTRAEFLQVHTREAKQQLSGAGVRVDPTAEQSADILKQIVERGMKADANGDGVIVWDEMLTQANARAAQSESGYQGGRESVPLSLDTNGDGRVSKAEFVALLDRSFNAADLNRDGRLSAEERAKLQAAAVKLREEEQAAERARREEEQSKALADRCGLPRVPASSKIVLLSGYEGQALSTVSLGGDDQEVSVARVVVEKGREPLALVLTSYSANIWLIDGDTARVSHVIASALVADQGKTPRVGVVGVPREKVTIAKSRECLRYTSGDRPQAGVAAKAAGALLGRVPEVAFAEYGLSTIAVPSGAIDKVTALPNTVSPRKTGPSAPVWDLMLSYNPKGLVDIDPKRVVSSVKASRYAVLPQQAGLAQLVESGSLEISGNARVIRLNGTRFELGGGDDTIVGPQGKDLDVSVSPSEFTIRKQITFPAGLNGGHSVTFILPDGVPEPLGSPGHSKVIRSK